VFKCNIYYKVKAFINYLKRKTAKIKANKEEAKKRIAINYLKSLLILLKSKKS
jgi:hypothetical protein